MFKIIKNMIGCHCTNPITQVAPGQEFHTQVDTDEEWNWMITKLQDENNNFTSDDVEGALSEAGNKIKNKQDKLVSGTNIKTINGESLLGNGDIEITGGGSIDTSNFATKTDLANKQNLLVSGTNVKTINGQSILGSGNIEITSSGGSGGYDDTQIKQDINNIKTEIGTEELTTTSKKIKGAINELDSQIKTIENSNGIVLNDIELIDINKSGFPLKLLPNSNINKDNTILTDINNVIIDFNNSVLNLTKETDSFLAIRNSNNIIIKNLKITGLNTTRSASCYGLHLFNVTNFQIDNVEVDGGNGAGIFISNCDNGVIKHCNVKNTLADGIHVTNKSKNIDIYDNTVQNPGDDAIAIVSYTKDNGVCKKIKIHNNTIINSKSRGIANVGGEDVIITNNTIDSTSSSGVIIATDSNYGTYTPLNTILSNNIILNAGSISPTRGNTFGIEVTSCDKCIITENIINNSKTRGIAITSSATNITFSKNRLEFGTSNQIESNGIVFTDNYIANFKENGLNVINLSNAIVTNNILKNNATLNTGYHHNLKIGGCNNVNAKNNVCIDDRETTLTKRSCEITSSEYVDVTGLISIGTQLGVATSQNIKVDTLIKSSSPSTNDNFYVQGTEWINTSTSKCYKYLGASWVALSVI